MYRPNESDVREWIVLCEWLEKQPKQSSYYSNIPKKYNSHLLVTDIQIFLGMRKWMKENECDCVFYSSGWGWRLRKNWRIRLERIANLSM